MLQAEGFLYPHDAAELPGSILPILYFMVGRLPQQRYSPCTTSGRGQGRRDRGIPRDRGVAGQACAPRSSPGSGDGRSPQDPRTSIREARQRPVDGCSGERWYWDRVYVPRIELRYLAYARCPEGAYSKLENSKRVINKLESCGPVWLAYAWARQWPAGR